MIDSIEQLQAEKEELGKRLLEVMRAELKEFETKTGISPRIECQFLDVTTINSERQRFLLSNLEIDLGISL